MLSRVNFAAPKGRASAPNSTLAGVLAAQGRGGDSLVAHINPQEAQILHALGGKGDLNPKTGLLEFDPSGSSGGPNGGSAGGDGNNGNNGGNAGGSGGYNGQGRGFGALGTVGGDLANDGSTRVGESAFHAGTAAYNGSALARVVGAKPDLANSASYADGTWHVGGSIPGAIAGLAAGAFMPGSGMVVGPAVGMAARAMGIGDTVLGGPGAPATEGMDRNAGVVGANGANMSAGSASNFHGGNSGLSGGGDPRQQMGPGAPQGTLAAALVPNTAGGGLNPAANPTGMPMAPWMHGMHRRAPLMSMHGVGGR